MPTGPSIADQINVQSRPAIGSACALVEPVQLSSQNFFEGFDCRLAFQPFEAVRRPCYDRRIDFRMRTRTGQDPDNSIEPACVREFILNRKNRPVFFIGNNAALVAKQMYGEYR